MQVQRYRRSPLWQRSREFAVAVYRITSAWPTEERFGLTSQTRRAAASIMGNIAEGQGRTGDRELKHRLSIANGSLFEAESYLLLSVDLGFNTDHDLQTVFSLSDEVGRMLAAAIRSLDRLPHSVG